MGTENYVSPDEGTTLYAVEGGDRISKIRVGNKSKEPIGNKKTALVMGAGGFIGSHMVKRLI